jgi:hypothetical protein
MPALDRYFDDDPPARRSPRLVGDYAPIEDAAPVGTLRATKPTAKQRARLRRDLGIYLEVKGGMSLRMVGKNHGLTHVAVLKICRRLECSRKRA